MFCKEKKLLTKSYPYLFIVDPNCSPNYKCIFKLLPSNTLKNVCIVDFFVFTFPGNLPEIIVNLEEFTPTFVGQIPDEKEENIIRMS